MSEIHCIKKLEIKSLHLTCNKYMMLSLFLFRYNLASRFYSFANPPSLFSFCGHNVCCLFHLIDFLLRTFFFSIQVYFSKESFSPFLVSRCHHCRFECQNFFLWSKLSDFFIWKIQTFFTLLKSRTKMECQHGINSKICQEFHFHSFADQSMCILPKNNQHMHTIII